MVHIKITLDSSIRNQFEDRYGKLWYLRDFDYLPELMTNRAEDFSKEFMEEVSEGRFKVYKNELEAWLDCIKIRKMLFGDEYKNRWMYTKILEIYDKSNKNEYSQDSIYFKNLMKEFLE